MFSHWTIKVSNLALIGQDIHQKASNWKPSQEMEELETALKRVEKKGLKDKMRGNH